MAATPIRGDGARAGHAYALRLVDLSASDVSLARNTGASMPRGDMLMLLDDDVEPLNPLLRRAALVVEALHGTARSHKVGDDEADSGNNSPMANSTFATIRRALVQLAA